MLVWEPRSIADRWGISGAPRKLFTNRAMSASKICRKVDDRYGPGHATWSAFYLGRPAPFGNFRLYGGRGTMPTHSRGMHARGEPRQREPGRGDDVATDNFADLRKKIRSARNANECGNTDNPFHDAAVGVESAGGELQAA